ncbi:MFS transporter [Mycetocola reblochoni]|uniref:Putative proline/betaine transporter n=2 Tax=Mycetocola reblochoni TaxID=331618 RepID=A0A1R4IL45_9MICO|nr:MFS transporter [Mycetocola reblochoni]RLP70141.1 MFS transporter [Mycetocola reblochoni]SJN20449.1 L-Proline/Glycine betaine transporter ProP [Mycetocola reblochoni REB411]
MNNSTETPPRPGGVRPFLSALRSRLGLGPRTRRLRVDDVTVVDKPMLRKAVAGTVVGNLMEWYDIGIYGYLAVIMGRVFLSDADDGVRNLFSLGVFAVTFLARPLGGIILGQLGDRMGRQKVLAFTLIMMAASTVLIGVLPGFATIGAWAPILLILLKLVQGFSTGGEYAGATTFITEYAPDRRRGFYASLLDMGSFFGFAFGAAVVSVLQLWVGPDAMEGWAWRLPFLLAAPLGLIAIYFRMKIEDTPAFQAAQELQEAQDSTDDRSSDGAPQGVIGLVRLYWKELLIAIVLVAAANTASYALTTYMPTYLTGTLHYDEIHGTLLTLPVLVGMALCIPLSGKLSDRFSRRRVLTFGAISTIVLAIPAFLLLTLGPIWSTLLGLSLLAIPVIFYIGNLASSLPALFPTASRYGAMGLSYNVAVALFGGTAPLILEAIVQATGNDISPAFYLIGTSVAGLIAVFFMTESARRPLPGSMPSVETPEEAHALVATQDENDELDVESLPFPEQGR